MMFLLCIALSIIEYQSRRKNWRDTPQRRLEQKVGKFLIEAYECANRLKVIQQEQIRSSHQRQFAEEQWQERIRQQQKELTRFEALEQTARDWQRARTIEAYVTELEQNITDSNYSRERVDLQEYIAWAKEKVAWLDPLVKREDPFLGKRKSTTANR